MELFSFWQYGFMVTALAAILIIAPLFGLMGTLVVEHKMAFFSDALGHSALTGVGIGIILGGGHITAVMIGFAVLFAWLLNRLKMSKVLATDTVISVFASLSLAAGLAILSRGGNFSQYSSLMTGDVLSIESKEIWVLAGVLLITVLFLLKCSNGLYAISISPAMAKSCGIPVKFLQNIFMVLLAVTVMLSIRFVGILLINALLILPAASARNMSGNLREYYFFSVLFSLFSGVVGLLLSFYCDIAAGSAIVIVAAAIFFGTFWYSRKYLQ